MKKMNERKKEMSPPPSIQDRSHVVFKSGPLFLIGTIFFVGGILFFSKYINYWHEEDVLSKISGEIRFFSVGRGEAIALADKTGKILASCNVLDCGYSDCKSDNKKEAVFIVQKNHVVEIEVEGIKKIGKEDISARNKRKIYQGVFFSILGIVLIIFGRFNLMK